MNDHVVDLAELYALGALEPEELAAIDAHVVSCADCRVAVGAAEATVAALDDAFVPHEDVRSFATVLRRTRRVPCPRRAAELSPRLPSSRSRSLR
jgi:anti-sigma factor ChrR (cupin superfamily)